MWTTRRKTTPREDVAIRPRRIEDIEQLLMLCRGNSLIGRRNSQGEQLSFHAVYFEILIFD